MVCDKSVGLQPLSSAVIAENVTRVSDVTTPSYALHNLYNNRVT